MGTHLLLVFLMVLVSLILPVVTGFFAIPEKIKKWLSQRAIWSLLIFSIFLIVYSFYATDWWTEQVRDVAGKGQVGDKIGGIMNPIVAIAAAIITGLAFWAQYQANIQIQNQFKIQQFESQFYEMLRLHKENVNEMELEEVICVDPLARLSSSNQKSKIINRDIFVQFLNKFEHLLHAHQELNTEIGEIITDNLSKEEIHLCYDIFFFGYKGQFQHFLDKEGWNASNIEKEIEADFPATYPGYSHLLGHYFRHLYHTVCLVTENPVLGYDEKQNYLKMLRAQLSNPEQAVVFYNWLSDYGKNWENDEINQNLFTEYNMIRNLMHDQLLQNAYTEEKIIWLQNKPVKFRKTEMFENPYKKTN